jgi:8-amino-7-oxononanoate synthase
LFEKGDTILFDKHIHASTVKGMVLSGAGFFGYNHNSMSHLSKRLEKYGKGHTAVLAESLFSMDGDFLPVEDFKAIKEKYGFLSIVDEAHSFGAVGEGGRGIARSAADIALGTFGKAPGLFGAFVLLPYEFREFLINFSSPVIYTTSLPEAHAASALDALDIMSKSGEKREHLRKISQIMKKELENQGFRVNGDAHILALEIGDETRAVELSRRLFERNIFTFPARFPTVPLGRAILRISLTALHTENDIMQFISAVKAEH